MGLLRFRRATGREDRMDRVDMIEGGGNTKIEGADLG